MEPLEERMLLALGPQLIGIQPNAGALLMDGDVRPVAPRELTFRFDESQVIDPSTLDGIRITRSGLDGVFGDVSDERVDPGFIGVNSNAPNEVVIRFSDTLPDDHYRIDVFGSDDTPGATALANVSGDPFNNGIDAKIDFELDLGAQIIAVVPQPIERNGNGDLAQASDQIVVYFNNDELDPAAAQNPGFYHLIDQSDGTILIPDSVEYELDQNSATLVFADDLPSRTFRLRIGGSEESNDTLDTANLEGTVFQEAPIARLDFELPQDEEGNDVPLPINDESTTSSTITVEDALRISDLEVQLDIDHTWGPDLRVFLTGPEGNRIELVGDLGSDALGGQIYGTKFEDSNQNGIQDQGEPGLEGWTIFLDGNRNGTLDAGEVSTVTDSSGKYSFTSLEPGRTYRVAEVPQAHWVQTVPIDGSNEKRFGADFSDGSTQTIVIAGSPTEGTFRLGVNARTTAEIEFAGAGEGAATAVNIRNALAAVVDPGVAVDVSPVGGGDSEFLAVFTLNGVGTPLDHPIVSVVENLLDNGNVTIATNANAEGFTSTGNANQWHLSVGRGTNEGHTGLDSFYFGAGEGPQGGGLYANQADGTLVSPIIDLNDPTITGPVFLQFNHFLQTESNFDFARVNVVGEVQSALVFETSEDTNGFETATVDISQFTGQKIRLEFNFDSDGFVIDEGWYVDDVAVLVGRGAYSFVVADVPPHRLIRKNVNFGSVRDSLGPDAFGYQAFELPSVFQDISETGNPVFETLSGSGFAVSTSGTASEQGNAVTVDAEGNAYVAGSFEGTVDFDPGPGETVLTSIGVEDMFVAKYTPDGSLVWVRQMGGTGRSVGHAIALDTSNNVHVTGSFTETIDFDPGPGTVDLTSEGETDIFAIKLDSSGNLVWARSIGGVKADEGRGVDVDDSGNVLLTGWFSDTADFDPGGGTLELTSAGETDIFVLKLDASSDLIWARRMGGAGADAGQDVALDAEDNVHTVGSFSGVAIFDPDPNTDPADAFRLTSIGGTDLFVSKLDADGVFVWARSQGSSGNDAGKSIAIDPAGNVYSTGVVGSDIFVAKQDSENTLLWARNFGGSATDVGEGIGVDSFGNVYVTGTFRLNANFGTSSSVILESAGGTDLFVLRLDEAGGFGLVRQMGGSTDDGVGNLALDGDNNVYTTGFFRNTATFDVGSGVVALNSAGAADAFLSKLVVPGPVDDGFALLPSANLRGFEFEYYGQTYSELFVSSNGLISFVSPNDSSQNTDFTDLPPEAVIAPFWDDLFVSVGDQDGVFWDLLSANGDRQLIIQWHNVRLMGEGTTGLDPLTFQVVLRESDNSIQFNYQNLENRLPQRGLEFPVGSFTRGMQQNSVVASDASGNYVVVWESPGQDEDGSGIFARLYDSGGTALSDELQVNEMTTGDQRNPAVAMDPAGNFMVVWEGPDGVSGRLFDAAGTPLVDELPISIEGGVQSPDVAANSNSLFVVTFERNGFVTVKTFALDGSVFGARDEVQRLNFEAAAPVKNDFFSLNFDGFTTGPIAFGGTGGGDLTAVGIEVALRLLPNTGDTLTVTPVPGNEDFEFDVTFTGVDGSRGQPLLKLTLPPLDVTGLQVSREVSGDSGETTADAGADPAVGIDNFGQVVVAFEKSDGDGNGIFGRFFLEDGTPLGGIDRNEKQRIIFEPIPFGGSMFSLIHDGLTTGPITYGGANNGLATAGAIQTALRALTNTGNALVVLPDPDVSDSNEIQIIRFTGGPTQGTFTLLTMTPEAVTSDITFENMGVGNQTPAELTAANIQAALPELGIVGATVRAVSPTEFEITFALGTDPGLIFVDDTNLDRPGSTVTTINDTAPSDTTFLVEFLGSDGGRDQPLLQLGDMTGGVVALTIEEVTKGNSASFRISTTTAGNQINPSIAKKLDAGFLDANFVVVWQSEGQDGDGFGIVARQFANTGEIVVNTTTQGNQTDPQVALDANGDFVVVWQSDGLDDDGLGTAVRYFAGDGTALTGQRRINTETAGDQRDAAVAIAPGGEAVATWTSEVNAGGIRAQRFDAGRNPVGDEAQVSVFGLRDQGNPVVAKDAAGNFVVVWESFGQEKDELSQGIFAQLFDSQGAPVTAEFQVNTTVDGNQFSPAVVMNSNGEFVVAWVSDFVTPGGQFRQDIYARKFLADGTPIGNEVLVEDFTTGFQVFPTVAIDGAGAFVVAWQDNVSDGDNNGVFARRFSSQANALGAAFLVNTTTEGPQDTASVAMDEAGNFVVVWESAGQEGGNSNEIVGRRYRADGTVDGDEFQINTFFVGRQDDPVVAMDSAGNFVVAWWSDGQDGDGSGIFAQRYNSEGVAEGSEFQVNAFTAGSQDDPQISMDAAGGFVVVWRSPDQDGSGNGVVAQRFTASGATIGEEFVVNTNTLGSQFSPSIAAGDGGDFVVTWFDGGQANAGVFAQRFQTEVVSVGIKDAGPQMAVGNLLQVSVDGGFTPLVGSGRSTRISVGPIATQRVFAVDGGSDLIRELDPETGVFVGAIPAPEPVAGNDTGLAFSGSSLFYVSGSGTLYELAPDTGAIVDADALAGLGIDDSTAGLAYLNGRVVVQDTVTGQLHFINPMNDQVEQSIAPTVPLGGALAGSGSRGTLFGTNIFGDVVELDPETGSVVNDFAAPTGPIVGLAFARGELLVGDNSGVVTEVDPDTGLPGSSFSTGLGITALGGDGGGGIARARGGNFQPLSGTIIDDEAGMAITEGEGPFTGRFRPLHALSDFDDRSARGDWILEVEDTATGDTGTLNGWSLIINNSQDTPADFTATAYLGDNFSLPAGQLANDVDLFRFEFEQAGTLSTLLAPTSGLDTLIRIFDVNGILQATADTGITGEEDTLAFSIDQPGTYYIGVSSSGNASYSPVTGSGADGGSTTGSYRLDLKFSEPAERDDENSSFGSATDLGVLGLQGQSVFAATDPLPYPLEFPGPNDEPGHRHLPDQSHLIPVPLGVDTEQVDLADNMSGIEVQPYNFRNFYGVDPDGVVLKNTITEAEKQRAREALEIYGTLTGVTFVETSRESPLRPGDPVPFTIAKGDMRAVNKFIDTQADDGIFVAAGLVADQSLGISVPTVVLDGSEQWFVGFGASDDPQQISSFEALSRGIANLLGAGPTFELPPPTVTGSEPELSFGQSSEPFFPSDAVIVHGQHLHRPESHDIDLYKFVLQDAGVFTAETIAERLPDASLLDTVITLYRANPNGTHTLLARNDDYFSEDSFLQLALQPGTYFIGVSASGNSNYNPVTEDSGLGGTSEGIYALQLNFRSDPNSSFDDASGTAIDGDADGVPGGDFNFWFRAAAPAGQEDTDGPHTLIVDKSALPGGIGSPEAPYNNIALAFNAAREGDIVRIVGNGGGDGDLVTQDDNLAYEIGVNSLGAALSDGETMRVPRGVTVMIDAGAIFKLRRASIEVGSSAPAVDRSGGALQVLGTPTTSVFFTSYDDETLGTDTDPLPQQPDAGEWGGILFRRDLDRADGRLMFEGQGVFLDYVNHADMRYGGGNVVINSVERVVAPIHMIGARPTISFNTISLSADAAMSADPDSFAETNFRGTPVGLPTGTLDYTRAGPDIHGNRLVENSINGLFIRVARPAGGGLRSLTVAARWDDTDVVHVVAENLSIAGTPGGPVQDELSNRLEARLDARLSIDPGLVVKLDGAGISAQIGAQLIAEGLDGQQVIFTSLFDDRYGAGGTFDTSGDGSRNQPAPGDWSGLSALPVSRLSIDHAFIAYGGGVSSIAGSFASFNAVEILQAEARIAHSELVDNASGVEIQTSPNRFGRGPNAAAALFVRGAQPVLVDNIIHNTFGQDAAAISINASALNQRLLADPGRSTGHIDRLTRFADNQGALIRGNRLEDNSINGLVVRGETLTGQGVFDDQDIVHVVLDEIVVPDFHTFGGLRLESSPTESLVVKFFGPDAGLTTTGRPLDISDRIGGTLHVIGQPGHPVIMTSLADDSVGAGTDINGRTQNDTNNDGLSDVDNGESSEAAAPQPDDWQGILLEQYTHDRNVEVVTELESRNAAAPGTNASPESAEFLGALAPHLKAGDDNLRLGFEVLGFLRDPADVDVFSFDAAAGTEVWFDIDRTSTALDTVVELIDTNGRLLARSDNSTFETEGTEALAAGQDTLVNVLQSSAFEPVDRWTVNLKDAGMRVVLPGTIGASETYHVRVRSSGPDLDEVLTGGLTSGVYQLQLRLQEVDEIPGTTVRFADIRYAENGIVVRGGPIHSPLAGEAAEDESPNDELFTRDEDGAIVQINAQRLGNVLQTDRSAVSLAGSIEEPTDVDWYQIEVRYDSKEPRSELDPDQFAGLVFDIDYADGFGGPNTRVSIFEAQRGPAGVITGARLIATADQSNVATDQPAPLNGADVDDLLRGSNGELDPYIGPINLPEGTYFVAVSSSAMIPEDIQQFVLPPPSPPDATNKDALPVDPLARFEPLDSVNRVVEDGFEGPTTVLEPAPFLLGDVTLYAATSRSLLAIDGFTGGVETVIGSLFDDAFARTNPRGVGDIAMRLDGFASFGNSAPVDGSLFAYSTAPLPGQAVTDNSIGTYLRIDVQTGDLEVFEDDQVKTFEIEELEPPEPDEEPQDPMVLESDVGIVYDAITFDPRFGSSDGTRQSGFVVGSRSDAGAPPNGETQPYNLLFAFDADTGLIVPGGRETPTVEDGELPDPPLIDAEPLLVINTNTGGGAGGKVTGIAMRLDGQIVAVTGPNDSGDGGGSVFLVNPGGGVQFLNRVLDDQGSPVPFSGLTLGPPNVKDGFYANTVFATTLSGDIYALDANSGDPLPILAGGTSHVNTGVGGLVGLAFSTLDKNLWHISGARSLDLGHGLNVPITGSRVEQTAVGGAHTGGASFHFGGFSTNKFDYDFPGGAHGSLVSNEFSLAGASAADEPVLYFSYFLDTEGTDFNPVSTFARDTFRVFVVDDSTRDDNQQRGEWQLLATNNDFRNLDPRFLTEFDDPDNNFRRRGPIQELFDNVLERTGNGGSVDANNDGFPDTIEGTGTWRQARISLAEFAGSDSLRLRFDFDTAGSSDVGGTGGIELRTVPGAELSDRQIFVVDGTFFEFDLGFTLAPPSGALLQDGEVFSIDDGNNPPVTFEMDRDGSFNGSNIRVRFSDDSTPAEVVRSIETAILSTSLNVVPIVSDGRIGVPGAQSITQSGNASILLEGSPGTTFNPVVVDASMDAPQVADAVADAIADALNNGVRESVQRFDNRVMLFNKTVDFRGPLGLTDETTGNGIFGSINNVWGSFGITRSLDFANDTRAQGPRGFGHLADFDNQFREGVYIDDLVIGFAERGEIISRSDVGPIGDIVAAPSTTFVQNITQSDLDILTGSYQLEIRRDTDLGVGNRVLPIFNNQTPDFNLLRTIDTNEQLARGFTIVAPPGSAVLDGQTFTIGDGLHELVFEYEDTAVSNGIVNGHVAVAFERSDSSSQMAQHVRDAINGPQAQATLAVVAALSDGTALGRSSTSNLVSLFANGTTGALPAPTGLDLLVQSDRSAGNRLRDQGQILIHSNRISHSAEFGIVVEDGVRDLPSYTFSPRLDHVQFVEADYTPHPGPVRNFPDSNVDGLVPGVTIENNVISFGGRGGIRYAGDPNGFVISGVNGEEIPEESLLIITDISGNSVTFEFTDGEPTDEDNVPISLADLSPAGITGAIAAAIEASDLNVTVFRGKLDEIFVEGAASLIAPALVPFNFFEVQRGSVPFGRIINNTIFGLGGNILSSSDVSDVGILVEEHASPTMLNNIVANFNRGIQVDSASQSSVLGGTVFQGNQENTFNFGLGEFVIVLANTSPLFVNPAAGNFYLAADSPAIDSSIDSAEDRDALVAIRAPLGIPPSPILAPDRDANGLLRVDDPSVELPTGSGEKVFKDRGALDRADFIGPTAFLAEPRDNDEEGTDLNPAGTIVKLADGSALRRFTIQFIDGVAPADPLDGTGVAPASIKADTVTVTRDGKALVNGVDYTFDFDTTNDSVLLTPVAGIWESDRTYVIQLDNSTIRDIAGNLLKANQPTGETQFTILLSSAEDFGDAPDPTFPTLLASNGARHKIEEGLFLGAGVDGELDGAPSFSADADALDDGVVFNTPLLPGSTATITVTASDAGLLDAWIDFDRDGTWDDPGDTPAEQIFSSRALVAGPNTLTVNVPAGAPLGTAVARFRFSTEGGLAPTGPAQDGEVEDYAVSIGGNPWQNPGNRMDVNNDGIVSALDVLIIFNDINSNGTRELPNPPLPGESPPPFLDVSGDGIVSAQDALIDINFLNTFNVAATASAEGRVNVEASQITVTATTNLLAGVDEPPVTRYESLSGDTVSREDSLSGASTRPSRLEIASVDGDDAPSHGVLLTRTNPDPPADATVDDQAALDDIAVDVDHALRNEDPRDALFARLAS